MPKSEYKSPVKEPLSNARTPLKDTSSGETLALLEELTLIFDAKDDLHTLNAIADLRAKAKLILKQQQSFIKDTIKELTQRVEEAQRASIPPESETEHMKRVDELEKQKKQVIENIMRIEEDCASKQKEIVSVRDKESMAKCEKKNKRNQLIEEIEKLRKIVQLYVAVSRIRLDFDAEPGICQGFIAAPEKEELRAFQVIDKDDFQRFNQVNAVWKDLESIFL